MKRLLSFLNSRLGVGIILCCVLCGCTSAPQLSLDVVDEGSVWRHSPDDLLVATEPYSDRWWDQFGIDSLGLYIDDVLANNQDLSISALRVKEFYYRKVGVSARRLPQLSVGGHGGRTKRSLEQLLSFPEIADRYNDTYDLNVMVDWELDLWGKIAAAKDAAIADIFAAEEERLALTSMLIATAVTEYVWLMALDAKLEAAQSMRQSKAQSLKSIQDLHDAGQVSELELMQVTSDYYRVQQLIPDLEKQIFTQENRLAFLAGKNPQNVVDNTSRAHTFSMIQPVSVPSGMPLDLLTRRPDIRRARQQAMATHALATHARREALPSLSVSGILGALSTGFSELFDSTAGYGSLLAGFAAPIYSGGDISANINAADTRQERAVIEYRKVVLNALHEVDNIAMAIQTTATKEQLYREQLDALKNYISVANDRYQAGFARYNEVLLAEMTLLDLQLDLIDEKQKHLTETVAMYKAMGGGWINAAAGDSNFVQKDDVLEKPTAQVQD